MKRSIARQGSAEVSLLLWAVWDPLDDVPLDEYAAYAHPLLRMLRHGADEGAMAAHLRELRSGMGLPPRDDDDRATAVTLTRWHYWRFVYPEELKS